MKRILKRYLFGEAALLLFFLIASQAGMAIEVVPLLPMTVEGVALVDGTPAPVGTVIGAYLNGEQVGKLIVKTSSGDYCFWISGVSEDEGKPVTFTVNGKNPEKIITWDSGKQVLSLQLSVGKGVVSGSYAKSFISGLNSESLTKIAKPEVLSKNYEARVIESSVPEPNVVLLKEMDINSGDKNAAKPAEDSSKPKRAPGFPIIYAVTGIILLVFVLNLMKERD
jgi:hypothetical protein